MNVRESLRGYSSAVLDQVVAARRAGKVADELEGFGRALDDHEALLAALTDPAVAVASRQSIVRDLLGPPAEEATTRLVSHAIASHSAAEFPTALEWLSHRARREADRREADRREATDREPAESGDGPEPGPLAGRSATRERVDGFASAVFDEMAPDGSASAGSAPAGSASASSASAGIDRQLGEIEDELFRFARTIESSDDLHNALTNADLPASIRRQIITELLGPNAQPATVRLAGYAVRAGRARDLVSILGWMVERAAAERNLRIAEVRSAVPLDDQQHERLAEALRRVSGKPVELRVVIDPTLIGGIVALVGDTIIDGSIRRRLDQLRSGLELASD